MPELATLISDLTCGDDQRAEAAVPHLVDLGEPAQHAILQLLKHDDPDHRWWAVRTLAEFGGIAATEGICRSLSDPEPSVRHCAALALRHKPVPEVILPLSNALNGSDRLFTRLVGDALSACGKLAIPALERCLGSQDPAIRGEAARALALMELPETIPVLFSASEDPSTIVQHWIEEGFNRLGVGMVYFKP